jgi:serine/threonine protein kinase
MTGARPLVGLLVAETAVGHLLAGRYRITELVGRGATARVWRAHDELLMRDVAVKQLSEEDPHSVAESRIAARIHHPNVAAVHDLVRQGGCYWLVMDYHPGGTLADLLHSRRRLALPVVTGLGLQILAALRAIHDAGVVHCDLKPANLLLSQDGRLVLTDFGIAETNDGGPTHPARQNGDVVGSPAYMAPELVRGQPPRPPADLWSLGATLYAAVEGRPPFGGSDPATILAAVLHDRPAPTHHAGRLGPLLSELLRKEPACRPAPDTIRAALADVYTAAHTTFSEASASSADLAPAEPS